MHGEISVENHIRFTLINMLLEQLKAVAIDMPVDLEITKHMNTPPVT